MRTHAIAILAVAACSSSSQVTDSGLPPDAAIVGPVDAPVVDLVQLCGAQPATPDDWERCYQKRKCEWEVGCVPATAFSSCLLYTSDAADERSSVDLGGRRII